MLLSLSDSANFTSFGKGHTKGFQSRSSVSEYLLHGDPKSEVPMRVEHAYVEGYVSMNPKIYNDDEKMVMISNQVSIYN